MKETFASPVGTLEDSTGKLRFIEVLLEGHVFTSTSPCSDVVFLASKHGGFKNSKGNRDFLLAIIENLNSVLTTLGIQLPDFVPASSRGKVFDLQFE